MTFLIVEDQAQMRAALREFVRTGYPEVAILEAADGARAVELCHHHAPSLVLTDIGLPDISGLLLIAWIRALLPAAACIVVSQHCLPVYVEKARAAGATAYVSKDAIYRDLLPAIAAALAGTPATGPDP